MDLGISQFCPELPHEFAKYMELICSLRDGQRPRYATLRRLFKTIMEKEDLEHDHIFDWTERMLLEKPVEQVEAVA